MKRVILDRDSVSRNELMSRKEEFITPRYVEDGYVYAYFSDKRFYLITKTGDDYKIVPLITGEVDSNRFKTLRGAVKHCLKKGNKVWEFENSRGFAKWIAESQGHKVLIHKTN